MESLFSGVPGFIWSLAGTAVIALCGYAWRKLKGFRMEHTALLELKDDFAALCTSFEDLQQMQTVQNAGLRNVLRNLMVAEHARLVAQGYATADEKHNFEELYKAYHALGGNGSGTALYNDVMKMHTCPSRGAK